MTSTTGFRASPDVDVSVLIAAYNCEAIVARAVTSALSQEGVRVEVIAVDDSSTDGTFKHLISLAAEEPRLRPFHLDRNGGPAVARNFGIAQARGTWIAILDADDRLHDGCLTRLVRRAEESRADIIAGNLEYFDLASRKGSGPAFRSDPPLDDVGLVSFLAGARPFQGEPDYGLLKPLFRRDWLRRSGAKYRPHLRHAEDFHLMFEALAGGAKFVFARDVLAYAYTTRASGFSRTKIDYRQIAAETRRLLQRPIVRGSADARRYLRDRMDGARMLELEHMGSTPSAERQRVRMLFRSLSSGPGRGWLISRLRRRFG